MQNLGVPSEALEEALEDTFLKVNVGVNQPLDGIDVVDVLEGVPLLPVTDADVVERREDVFAEIERLVFAALPERDLERLEVLELAQGVRERLGESRQAGVVVGDKLVRHVLREEGENEVGEVLGAGEEDRRHVVVQVCYT